MSAVLCSEFTRRTRCTNFYQNRLSFVEDVTKHFNLFFEQLHGLEGAS